MKLRQPLELVARAAGSATGEWVHADLRREPRRPVVVRPGAPKVRHAPA